MEALRKRGKGLAMALYFSLLLLLVFMMIIHAFRIYPLEDGFFTRYLVALVFVLMVLPLVPKVKIFDIVDIKRETRMFKMKRK